MTDSYEKNLFWGCRKLMIKAEKGLNILYVGTLPPHPGGAAIANSQLLARLSKLGHRVRSLVPIPSGELPTGTAFARLYQELSVTTFPIPHFHIDPNVPAPEGYRRLERTQIQKKLPCLIEKERPDIVLIGRGIFILDVPDIAGAYSIPCVLRSAGATTHGILNQTSPEMLLQQLLKNYHRVNLIIAVASHMAESLQRLGLKSIKTIANAIDLDQFCPRRRDTYLLKKLAIRNESTVVVHVSNLKTLKRPLDIVNSAEKAIQQNANLIYVIVGDGPMCADMRDACRRKSLSENFRFLGWVDHNHMPDYINLADIVVMSSEGEGLAGVYLEAQACGRLLLSSDIPAAREVIREGETGLLFRKGDIDELVTKILYAEANPKLRADIGCKAREFVQTYSLDDAIAEYENTMIDVINKHRANIDQFQVLAQ